MMAGKLVSESISEEAQAKLIEETCNENGGFDMAKLVSKVYGDALFSLAVEENRVDELWDETRAMKQVLSENPDFMAILEHPEMTMEKKMDVLQEVFQKELSQDMMGLLHVLVKKGRIGELIPVLAYFNECAMAYKKIGKVQIQTPNATIGETKKEN